MKRDWKYNKGWSVNRLDLQEHSTRKCEHKMHVTLGPQEYKLCTTPKKKLILLKYDMT